MQSPPDVFFTALASAEIALAPETLTRLGVFVDYLLEVNQRMNLTAVRDAEGVWMRHVFDSLLVLPQLKADPEQLALDLGSGGGLPGIPLAIARPDMQWTLVDSVEKKARYLAECAAALELTNVRAVRGRAEELGRDPAHRACYHLVTARAVARLPVLLEYTVPLLRLGGRLLAMKGEQAAQELNESRRAMEILQVHCQHQRPQPGGGVHLWFKKNQPTPETFPRGVGIPAQSPLGGLQA